MPAALQIPAKILRANGLNIDGVAIDARGRVTFVRKDRVLNFSRTWKSRAFQKDVMAARRTAARLAPLAKETDASAAPFLDEARRRLKLSGEVVGAMRNVAAVEQSAEFEQRTGRALDAMRRSAVVRFENKILLLSTQNAAEPEVVVEAEPGNETELISADSLVTGAEIVWELATGLLTLLGVPLRTGLPVGKFVERIVDIIRKNRRLRRLVLRLLYAGKKGQLSVYDLLTLLKELFFYGFTWDCVKASLDEIVDLSFWGLIRLLFKLQARLTPGVGQALLIADLGLIIAELVQKIARLL